MKEIDGFETLKLRYLNGNRKVKDEIGVARNVVEILKLSGT